MKCSTIVQLVVDHNIGCQRPSPEVLWPMIGSAECLQSLDGDEF